MTEPNSDFLKRTFDADVSRILNHYAYYVEEAVNYGTHLLAWQADESKTELVVTKLFLRSFLETLDALSLLIRAGSADICKSLLRNAFEINMYVHFIYDKHTRLRADAFWIMDVMDRITELEKMDKKTERGKAIKAIIDKEGKIKNFDQKIDHLQIAEQLKELRATLDEPRYSQAMAEYKGLKAKKIYWYMFFEGVNSIEQLAVSLSKQTFYEILYRNWSKTVHGIDIIKDKLVPVSADEAYLTKLRLPKGLALISKYGCNFAINTFGYYIKGSFPDRLSDYRVWENEFIANYEIDLGHEYINITP